MSMPPIHMHTASEFLIYMSSLLTSPGLLALLSFSRYSPDTLGLLPTVISSVCISLAIFIIFHDKRRKALPFVCLANTTFGLVVTMAVLLNIIAQLCPPQGKELALIPVYVLICMARVGPSMVAYALQALFSLALAVAFLFSTTNRSARPGNSDKNPDPGENMDFFNIIEILACTLYACTPQLTGIFDWLRVGTGTEWVWVESKNGWYLHTGLGIGAAATVARGVVVIFLFLSSNSVIYNFFYPPKAVPVSNVYMVLYGILLAFSCMQLAACWFNALQKCVEQITRSAFTASKLARMQHILYALLVASAWIYPLQLASLRVGAVIVLLVLNFM
jgi:hypothetical protein